MDQKKIGKFIFNLRTEKKLSQSQLAELIPISRQAISNWEVGKSIPDSSTLIILSKIFDVSINELLSGERKKNETISDLEQTMLSVADDNINKSKIIKKIFFFFCIIIIFLLLAFFIYFFINSYDTVKIYKTGAYGDKFSSCEGVLIITKEELYFRLGSLKGDNTKIDRVRVYYLDKNKNERLIFENDELDILIHDYFGYNEYFLFEDIEYITDNLFLEIYYDEDLVEKIKIEVEKVFSNSNLFFKRRKNIGSDELKFYNVDNNKLIEQIKSKFDKIDDGYRYETLKENEKISYLYFDDSLGTLFIDVVDEKKVCRWNISLKYNSYSYSEILNDEEINRYDVYLKEYSDLSDLKKENYKRMLYYLSLALSSN
ncbi:MAG: helix-turn-helix transcriptional regulator [Bacilli bacterium]|nr:helix-turn-helix transcriptional regulator [Bacilli bacterium]